MKPAALVIAVKSSRLVGQRSSKHLFPLSLHVLAQFAPGSLTSQVGGFLSHFTAAASPGPQLWLPRPLCAHSRRFASVPPHPKSSKWISPLPVPYFALWKCATYIKSDFSWSPSCLQTTAPSLASKASSHTMPHVLEDW